MSQRKKPSSGANVAPLYAAQQLRTPARRRAGALLMGTALSAVIGLGYGRGAYAQGVTPSGALSQSNNATVDITGPGTFETSDGFSVDTTVTGGSGGNAITTTTASGETGDTTFNDNYASSITGALNGIFADNDGGGALSITTTGTVAGTDEGGIYANNSAAGTGLTITVNESVTGGTDGVAGFNLGTGKLNITTHDNITGQSDDAIYALNEGTNLKISTLGNVLRGGANGINARNLGTGALTITSKGAVEGASGNGINVFEMGSYVSLSTNKVTGYTTGIYVRNDGTGAMNISTSGDVVGENAHGIDVFNNLSATDLTLYSQSVSGKLYGIEATHNGSGQLEITTAGHVASTDRDGINAWSLSGTNSYINVNSVTGGADGVDVKNEGSGKLLLSARGEIIGQTFFGIEARNEGSDLVIISQNVKGVLSGIDARNTGTGELSITSNEEVVGEVWSGIEARNMGTNLVINADHVTGNMYGIYAKNGGSGFLRITANGAVTGVTDDGIYANNASTENLTITIAEGGSVSTDGTDTANDFAIEAIANNGAVIVDNFGTVTGRVSLTNSNTFTNAGTWDPAGTTSNFNAQGNSLVVNEGLIIAAKDGAVNEISAIDNLDTFRNNAGGTIRLTDGAAGDLLLINGNGATGVVGNGAGTFVTNGGTIELDVDLSRDDRRDFVGINGNLRLGDAPTALSITPVGVTSAAEATDSVQIVRVGTGNGETSDAGAFVLGGPAEVGALSYDLSLGQCDGTADANWYLCNNGAIGTTGAVFEAMPGVVLNSFARTETLQQRLGARVQGGTGPTLSTQGDADLPVAQSVGPWMRTWGDFADITPDNSTAGTSWEADSWGLEAGIGTILGDHAGGNLVGGVNLRYGATYADLSNPVGTASLNAEGFGMAASLTWFGNDGFYVDGNAAVDFVSIDATSQGGGELLNDHDDVVYSASAEVGKRIELQGGTTLVPQAQLSWGKMRDGSLTDNLGNVVSLADRETLTSRVGLTVEQYVTGSSWGAGKVFGFGNVLHDLEGSRTATVAGTDVTQSGTGDWLELGGGFSLQLTENSNVFGQVSYREAFNGVDGDAIAVSAGWRMQW